MTVNSFTSVSASPPLVLVCVDLRSLLLPHFEQAYAFGLSFLASHQQDLSDRFAFVPERRFDGVPWRTLSGTPIIDEPAGWLTARLETRLTLGDHRVLVGEVIDGGFDDTRSPLLYFRSAYREIDTESTSD